MTKRNRQRSKHIQYKETVSHCRTVATKNVVHLYKPDDLVSLATVSVKKPSVQEVKVRRIAAIRGGVKNILLGITSKDLVSIARRF